MSSHSPSQRSAIPAPSHRLPVVGFLAVVVVYLVLVKGLSLVLTRGLDAEYAAPTNVNELWRSVTVPVVLSVLFVAAVISWAPGRS